MEVNGVESVDFHDLKAILKSRRDKKSLQESAKRPINHSQLFQTKIKVDVAENYYEFLIY